MFVNETIYENFMKEAKAEKEGLIKGVNTSHIKLNVEVTENEGVKNNSISINMDGRSLALSERATKNLLSLTHFPKRLVSELTNDRVYSDLSFQLNKVPEIGISVVGDEVISMFDSKKNAYVGYDELVPPKEELVSLYGSPLSDDKITFLTNEKTLSNVMDEMFIGINAGLSSTGNERSEFSFGAFRVVCSNGLVDSMFSKDGTNKISPDFWGHIRDKYKNTAPLYAKNLERFIQSCNEYDVKDVMHAETLSQSLPLPMKLKKEVLPVISNPDDFKDTYKRAGIKECSNLWEFVNLFTYFTTRLKNRTSMNDYVYRWANQVLDLSLN
jgi:hypothetical protein